jgi:hypothetical protein
MKIKVQISPIVYYDNAMGLGFFYSFCFLVAFVFGPFFKKGLSPPRRAFFLFCLFVFGRVFLGVVLAFLRLVGLGVRL